MANDISVYISMKGDGGQRLVVDGSLTLLRELLARHKSDVRQAHPDPITKNDSESDHVLADTALTVA
jgi:hypothetical protein